MARTAEEIAQMQATYKRGDLLSVSSCPTRPLNFNTESKLSSVPTTAKSSLGRWSCRFTLSRSPHRHIVLGTMSLLSTTTRRRSQHRRWRFSIRLPSPSKRERLRVGQGVHTYNYATDSRPKQPGSSRSSFEKRRDGTRWPPNVLCLVGLSHPTHRCFRPD